MKYESIYMNSFLSVNESIFNYSWLHLTRAKWHENEIDYFNETLFRVFAAFYVSVGSAIRSTNPPL